MSPKRLLHLYGQNGTFMEDVYARSGKTKGHRFSGQGFPDTAFQARQNH